MSTPAPHLRALACTALLALAASALAACADSAPQPPPPVGRIPSVLIRNDSQFVLRELRIHRDDTYLASPNVLREPLPVGGALVFYGDGLLNFTVLREKFAAGPVLAFTTARPVGLYRDKAYQLSVYDESFRLTEAAYIDPKTTLLPVVGDPGSPTLDASTPYDAGPQADAEADAEADTGPDAGLEADAAPALDGETHTSTTGDR